MESQIEMDCGHLEAVLAGKEALEISHAGGELKDIWHQLYDGMTQLELVPGDILHHDTRTRRNRTQNRSDAFDAIMEPLTSAYMAWHLERPEEGCIIIEHGPAPLSRKTRDMGVMHVLDLFCCFYTTAQQFTDADCIPTVLMRQGVILIAYEPYMHQQFTICYDLYVAILKRVEHHINQVLCHDAADYRLQNACAACTLSLRDEPGTPIHPHYCMDGNNSLKRLQRQDNENQESSQERMDNRDGHGDYFLSQDEVNAWSKEAIGNTIVTDVKDTEGNPCADRWENC
ncbi:hypothetical protein EDD85DRAFT_796521 [Armillaria nabsnona]|nr:hypothetical protein EDD85DRAFT_796521 [Armillaria nabsnona]